MTYDERLKHMRWLAELYPGSATLELFDLVVEWSSEMIAFDSNPVFLDVARVWQYYFERLHALSPDLFSRLRDEGFCTTAFYEHLFPNRPFMKDYHTGNYVKSSDWEFISDRGWLEAAPPGSRIFRIDPDFIVKQLRLLSKPIEEPETGEAELDYDRLPFPFIFVGWGGTVTIAMREVSEDVHYFDEQLGIVFDAVSRTTAMLKMWRRADNVWMNASICIDSENPPDYPIKRERVIAKRILDCVCTHEISQRNLSKKRVKALQKANRTKNVPHKYYEVLQQPLRRDKPEPQGTHASPSFQHDVRGHWAHRVKRIHGTLQDHERSRWEVRSNDRHQYRFVCGDKITEDDRKYLSSIGEPPPSKGWYLRITRYWVRGHKRGPEDTYVPSVHVMGPNLATHPDR